MTSGSTGLTHAPAEPELRSALELAVIEGDDIGPDVVAATLEVMTTATRRYGITLSFEHLPAARSAVASHGTTMPPETLERIRRFPGGVLGPVGHGEYPADDPAFPNPSGVLRRQLDLYANIRPARTRVGVPAHADGVDLIVVRENTEGFYADRNTLDGNGEVRPDEDMVISLRVITRRACLRIAEAAFKLAASRNRPDPRVTAVHKANVLRRGDGLFLECCAAVAARYPQVRYDDRHVDAFTAELLRDPGRVDVVVTTNMFGDILSDLAAELVGGLGVAGGLNVGADFALAQAVHGSAPCLAGSGKANPTAEILSGILLLDWLGHRHGDVRLQAAARDATAAVDQVLADGPRTPDLGGSATTHAIADAIVGVLNGMGERP